MATVCEHDPVHSCEVCDLRAEVLMLKVHVTDLLGSALDHLD